MESNFGFRCISSELAVRCFPRLQNNWGNLSFGVRKRRASLGRELANSPSHLGHCFNVAHCEHLLEISGEQKIKRPTGHHAQLFRQAWQFEEIDRPPHEPCEESGKIHAQDRCDPGVMPNGRQLPERLERKGFHAPAEDCGFYVLRGDQSLPQTMLRCRRVGGLVRRPETPPTVEVGSDPRETE